MGLETTVHLDSPEPVEVIRRTVETAERACFTIQALSHEVLVATTATLNGAAIELTDGWASVGHPDRRDHVEASPSHIRHGVLVTDQPWDEERAKEVSLFDSTHYAENFGVEFGDLIARDGYRRVGVDNFYIYPVIHYLPLVEMAPDTKFEGTRLIDDVYKIKSPAEIELIRKADQAAVAAVEAGFHAGGVGVTESEFALATEHALRANGELELGGGSIISDGPNTGTRSGLPSHNGSFTMKTGDWALFDICPSYEGYAGDISHMIRRRPRRSRPEAARHVRDDGAYERGGH